jgi:rhodanese-related sulfurtransferase
VYPAHGAGSLCGRSLSKETFSTIGEQRRTNHALRPMSRQDFVRMATADLPEVPAYFARDVALNRAGPASAPERLPPPLPPAELDAEIGKGAVVLDVRAAAAFGTAHVPGSVNIGLNGQFAPWAGTLLAPEKTVLIVAEGDEEVREAALRLARVGVEKVGGFLAGGIAAWEKAGRPLAALEHVTVDELSARLAEDPTLQVVDVRRPAEFAGGHVPRALSHPLDRFNEEMPALDPSHPAAVICAGGYRSSAAASLLQARGFSKLLNVAGGTAAWVAAGLPTES